MKTSRRALPLMILLTMALASCAGSPDDAASPSVHPGALVGTWTVDETFDGPEQPFVSFVQDNTWSASDGCNRVQGTWELGDDGSLTTTSGPQTLMACEGAQLPLAVSMASRVELDGEDGIILYSTDGSTTTTLVRSTDPNVGPEGLPIGYWVEERTPESPFLSISADGTFSGNDGCNVIRGSWEAVDDSAVQFSDIATTLMACEGVDQWLSQASLVRVRAGVLTVQDADGVVLGQLTAM